MNKNNTLLYILGGGALIAGVYYLTKNLRSDTDTIPKIVTPPGTTPVTPPGTTPVTPPGTTPVTPPSSTPLKIGDRVVATNTHFGVSELIGGKMYTDGGSNGNGQIEANKYAGVIISFVPYSNWVIVENYTYPMIDDDGNYISRYRLNKTLLRKQ